MTDADVLAFGPRPPQRSAPESLLLQAEESLQAVEVYSSMLSDRLQLLRRGISAPGGRSGLPAARVVNLTATAEAMLDATDAVFDLLDPRSASLARGLADLARRLPDTPQRPDEEPHDG